MDLAKCTWCGAEVEPGDGFRAFEPAGERRAVFCRLEHVVPWVLRGATWEPAPAPAAPSAPAGPSAPEAPGTCAWCGSALEEGRVVVVRERGEHRIADDFCSTAHLLEWAKAGGRYAS
jgi:ribosomal protein L24E